eukprot:TRINITY_DN5447_c0_g1_i2.p1 TRINITY_DN5447_c0_g1~~TRINITY_DN5447_c0_g1_i2.p1  ORF type:complete len:408 (+),score=79.96 TRINITY_DN5447_c0_g1_i2:109-1224(+)
MASPAAAPGAAQPAPAAQPAGAQPAPGATPFSAPAAADGATDVARVVIGLLNRATPQTLDSVAGQVAAAVAGAHVSCQHRAAVALAHACAHRAKDCPARGVSAEVAARAVRASAEVQRPLLRTALLCMSRVNARLQGPLVSADITEHSLLPMFAHFGVFFHAELRSIAGNSGAPADRAVQQLAHLSVRGLCPAADLIGMLEVLSARDDFATPHARQLACALQVAGGHLAGRDGQAAAAPERPEEDDCERVHLSRRLHCLMSRIERLCAAPPAGLCGYGRHLLRELLELGQHGWVQRTLVELHARPVTVRYTGPPPRCSARNKKGLQCQASAMGYGARPDCCVGHQPQPQYVPRPQPQTQAAWHSDPDAAAP